MFASNFIHSRESITNEDTVVMESGSSSRMEFKVLAPRRDLPTPVIAPRPSPTINMPIQNFDEVISLPSPAARHLRPQTTVKVQFEVSCF